MSDSECGRPFEEELLSGYLDRVLTQGDAQRVRLHLETCASCRRLYEEMEELRLASLSTRFEPLEDVEWNETPRSVASRIFRSTGLWLLALSCMLALVSFFWPLANGEAVGRFFGLGAVGGLGLALISALLDRLRVLDGDRYRRVRK